MIQYNYDDISSYYDILEGIDEDDEFNRYLEKVFEQNNCNSILDMTCGTGSQAIYLHKRGFDISASDINHKMLKIAKSKYSKLDYHLANMINVDFGKKFDAIISIFNAIGHLTPKQFEDTIQNVRNNLKDNGIYVFDIFNFDFMKKIFVENEFIDVCKNVNGTKFVRFNKNSLDQENMIMNINQNTYIEKGLTQIKKVESSWDMQIYTADILRAIFEKNDFTIDFYSRDGKKFDSKSSFYIVGVARKVNN